MDHTHIHVWHTKVHNISFTTQCSHVLGTTSKLHQHRLLALSTFAVDGPLSINKIIKHFQLRRVTAALAMVPVCSTVYSSALWPANHCGEVASLSCLTQVGDCAGSALILYVLECIMLFYFIDVNTSELTIYCSLVLLSVLCRLLQMNRDWISCILMGQSFSTW